MAGVYGDGRAPGDRIFLPLERLIYRACRRRRQARAALDRLRLLGARVQPRVVPRRVRPPAPPGLAAVQPERRVRSRAAPLVQHGRQLHDEHELAVLRRRVDDEPPHPDDRARRAELRIGSRRDGGDGGADSRHRPPPGQDARQLLGRPHPLDRAHPPAPVARRRRPARQPRRHPELPRAHGRHDAGRHDASDRRRAGGQPDRDQAARHQRRWVLQRQLGSPVRELDAVQQLHRDVQHRHHPLRPGIHVRAHGQGPPAGPRRVRHHGGDLGG